MSIPSESSERSAPDEPAPKPLKLKNVLITLLLVATGAAAMVGTLKMFSGGTIQQSGGDAVVAKTERLYGLAKDQRWTEIEAQGLATPASVQTLREYERKFGPIESFRVEQGVVNMFGSFATAIVHVQRSGRQIKESAQWEATSGKTEGPIVRVHTELEMSEVFRPRVREASPTAPASSSSPASSLPTGN